MQIHYSGTYSPRHLVRIGNAAGRLVGAGGTVRRAGSLGITGVALVLVPIALFAGGAPSTVLTWIPIGIIALGLVALNEWGVRRQFERGPLANQPVSGTVNIDGFTIMTPHTSSTIRWPAIRNYVHSADYILLLDQTQGVFGLARDFFSTPSEYEQAAAIIREHAVRRPAKFLSWNRIFRLIVWVVLVVTVFLLWALFRMRA